MKKKIYKDKVSESVGFDARQTLYAKWKANPYRKETKEEFASSIKRTARQLERWDKLLGFKELVNSLIDEYTDGEEAEIWRAVIENAKIKEGNSDRRLFFQLKGKLIESKKIEHSGEIKTALVEFIGGDDGNKPDEDKVS